jgi:hypothetical protein
MSSVHIDERELMSYLDGELQACACGRGPPSPRCVRRVPELRERGADGVACVQLGASRCAACAATTLGGSSGAVPRKGRGAVPDPPLRDSSAAVRRSAKADVVGGPRGRDCDGCVDFPVVYRADGKRGGVARESFRARQAGGASPSEDVEGRFVRAAREQGDAQLAAMFREANFDWVEPLRAQAFRRLAKGTRRQAGRCSHSSDGSTRSRRVRPKER